MDFFIIKDKCFFEEAEEVKEYLKILRQKFKIAIKLEDVEFIYSYFILNQKLSVFENIKNKNMEEEKEKNNVLYLLRLANLKKSILKYPRELSGIDMQCVCILKAMNKNAKVIICDDPTNFFDNKGKRKILKLLADCSKKGVKIILITTDSYAIKYICSIAERREIRMVEL